MLNIASELKELRLHGMADAWAELIDQDTSSAETSKLLLEHLLRAEHTDRAMRYLVNALEREKHDGKAGRIARTLMRMDLMILDELGYLPFTRLCIGQRFHLVYADGSARRL